MEPSPRASALRDSQPPAGPAVMREDDIRPQALLDEFFAHLERDADRLAARRAEFIPVACAFCGSDADADVAFEKDGFSYVECASCGSLYCSPRPTAATLTAWMADSAAVRFWSTHFYRQTAVARREQIYRPRAEQVGRIAAVHAPGRPITVADVGAGYGLFLSELAAIPQVGRVIAIEPDSRLAATCREQGYETLESWVEDLPSGQVAADLVTAFEVIEHVFDPVAFLASAARLAPTGGLILVTTLAITGFDLQVLWDRSRSITPPQHLNFPSLRGLERAATRAGLEVVDISTPGKLDVDIVRNRVLRDPTVEVPRFVRSLVMADPEVRNQFQSFLQTQRLSSHVHALLRRM
jgi:SAM-dependent methyltransferase